MSFPIYPESEIKVGDLIRVTNKFGLFFGSVGKVIETREGNSLPYVVDFVGSVRYYSFREIMKSDWK